MTSISNWRERPANAQRSTAQMGRSAAPSLLPSHAGTSRAPRSNYNYSTSRVSQNWMQHPKDAFQVGTIITAPLHEQDDDNKIVDPNDPHVTSSWHGPIYTKVRKMVIVARYARHYVALPLYTHQGVGVTHRPDKNDFVSVKDHRSQVKVNQQSDHRPLVTQRLKDGVELYLPESAVHLTYPHARKYIKPCEIEGYLDDLSVDRLIELYQALSQEEY